MHAPARPYVIAGAALAATSVIIVTPVATKAIEVPVRSIDTRLVGAEESVANIPINLFDDVMNIPYNEIQGVDVFSNSLFFSGDWWVPNATNLWGTDPGDIGHYMGLIDMMMPIPQISGLDQAEIDPTADAGGTAGLAQQIALLAAAELPTSASCDAQTCAPMTPPDVITGSTGTDRDLGFLESLTGQQSFGLFDNWFKVPLSDLTSGNFTFNSTTDPGGIVDPSPDTGPGGSVASAFGFDGTTAGDMPWDGVTFQLNPFGPLQDFYNSLLAAPSTTGIELPTSTDILEAFQNVAASTVVAYDPYVEGSPACPALCDIPASDTQQALVHDILAWDPSNTTIQEWLNNNPADSTATSAEVADGVALLQTGAYNLTPTELATYDADLTSINPELPNLFTNAGIVTDPNYEAIAQAVAQGTTQPALDPTYGGYNPALVGEDLLTLLTNNETNWSELSNPAVISTLLDPLAGTASPSAGAATDLSGMLGGSDTSAASDAAGLSALIGLGGASSISAELSALLSQLSADLSSALSADLGTTLATDLGTTLPSSLLSLF